MLENLKSIKVDPKLTNIISNEIGRELYIENEFHKAKGFRKLHIEVAEFSKNLNGIRAPRRKINFYTGFADLGFQNQ